MQVCLGGCRIKNQEFEGRIHLFYHGANLCGNKLKNKNTKKRGNDKRFSVSVIAVRFRAPGAPSSPRQHPLTTKQQSNPVPPRRRPTNNYPGSLGWQKFEALAVNVPPTEEVLTEIAYILRTGLKSRRLVVDQMPIEVKRAGEFAGETKTDLKMRDLLIQGPGIGYLEPSRSWNSSKYVGMEETWLKDCPRLPEFQTDGSGKSELQSQCHIQYLNEQMNSALELLFI
ncbi:hypothetical protein R3P38DRAFT_3359764 [Favolaschia claudopus]|uniref:Uncharacterized protein n=1 Tax=Favolaschia claudopus TaxID=2862362 RepID=A0AAW0AZW3_9AGAR